jgi:hypothetical protein
MPTRPCWLCPVWKPDLVDTFIDKLGSRDMRWYAVLISCLFSLVVIAANPIPNDDAFSYLRAAELFSQQGLDATLAAYGWYGYSVLIAIASHVVSVDLVTSAHLVNTLAIALLVYAFITLVAEFNALPRVQVFATAVILCYPTLNEMRFNLIRDFAYWGFCLTALIQLIRYNSTGNFIHAWGWLLAMAAAVFFRLEGLLVVLASPMALLLPGMRPMPDRLKLAGILLGFMVAGVILILLVFLPADVNLIEVFNFAYRWYLPLLVDYPSTLAGAATSENLSFHLSSELEYFTGKGLGVLLIGYLYAVIVNLVMAAGPAATLFLAWCLARFRPAVPVANRAPWWAFLVSALLALLIFVSIMQFLTTRYAVMAALLLLSLLPLCIEAQYRRCAETATLKKFHIMFMACLVYFLVDSLVSFGYSKRYIEDAIDWSRENIDNRSTLATNSFAVAYYSGMVENYDEVDPDPLLLLSAPTNTEFLVIDMHHDNREALSLVSKRSDLNEVARFSNQRDDAMIIFKVN